MSFETFSGLKLHSHTNHNRRLNATRFRPYQVQKGNLGKSLERSEQNKLIDNHERRTPCACGLCGRKFLTKEKRDHHEANHSKMKFKCSCGFLFLKSPGFKSHMQYAHKSTTRASQKVVLYKCPVNQCGSLYENFLELIAHTVENHGTRLTKEERKACIINENVFNKETINDFSGEASQMQNEDQESESAHSSRLDSKRQRNSRNKSNYFPQCDLCKRRFVKKRKRDHHVLHHNEMTYRCPVQKCEQLFEIFVSLVQHCRDHHNLRLRQCEQEMCKINQTQNETAHIKGINIPEQDVKVPGLGTDVNSFEKELT